MLPLVRHIKTLLLTHEHVALPQFGTFFTEVQPTGYEASEVFMPTRRTLRFTAEIDDTDTLLLDSYRTTYRLTPERARQRLDRDIAEAGKTLASTGTLDFDTLGMFTLTGGRITFETCKATLIVPEMYGLDAFTMPALPSLGTERTTSQTASQTDAYVIRLSRSLVHTAASIAAAIILFFIISTPLQSPSSRTRLSSILPTPVKSTAITLTEDQSEAFDFPETTATKAQSAANAQTEAQSAANAPTERADAGSCVANESLQAPAQSEANAPSATQSQPAATASPLAGAYTIVLATGVSQRNAEAFIGQLARAGIEGAEIHMPRQLRRVIYKRFATESDAYNAMRSIQTKSHAVSEAWVMKLPTR